MMYDVSLSDSVLTVFVTEPVHLIVNGNDFFRSKESFIGELKYVVPYGCIEVLMKKRSSKYNETYREILFNLKSSAYDDEVFMSTLYKMINDGSNVSSINKYINKHGYRYISAV